MASFRELAAFAQFGSSLDAATQAQLNRGQRLQEILKQPQYEPVPIEEQVIAIFAGTRGFADEVPIERTQEWEAAMLRFMGTSYPDIGKDIAAKKSISDDTEAKLRTALDAFNANWQ
jgi:F-type H+-transporting ATPase subunit alpha